MKTTRRALATGIIIGGACTAVALSNTSENIIMANSYRDVKIVDLMFTVYCSNCGSPAEGDYSIVSERGQIWCNECNTYEELNKSSDIVQYYFGEDKYER